MMKWVKKLLFVGVSFGFVMLTACSTSVGPAESYPGETAAQIFKKGEDELRDKNYAQAIKRFEALDVQYPYEHSTEIAQLHIIYAYYMNSDYSSAESAADRFIHGYPTNPHIDYAYYMRGLSNYFQNLGVFEKLFAVDLAKRDLSQIKKSYADFSEVGRTAPDGPYAAAAHQYMVYLRNLIANHELEVAQYYYSREAYVAAVERANRVVRHYQGAPSVPDALVLMIKSYRALHLASAEKDALQVLEQNYPHSAYLTEVSH